ncbi:MAG: hypothetical protein WCK31_04785 [bacterium]
MGLLIGNAENPVTLLCDSGNFEQVNAYAGLPGQVTFDRERENLQMFVKINKTKADYRAGIRGFVPDAVGSIVSVPCTIAEFEGPDDLAYTVYYSKLKAKLKEMLNTEFIYDDIPVEPVA